MTPRPLSVASVVFAASFLGAAPSWSALAAPAARPYDWVAPQKGIKAAPDDSPLSWTPPCSFAHRDGKPFEMVVPGFLCDYMQANLKDPVSQFNALPTFAAQNAQLRSLISEAVPAIRNYGRARDRILKASDPKTVPAALAPSVRLAKLMALNKVTAEGLQACAPFLWPKREESSYLQKTHGEWPASWKPCMTPFYDRWNELYPLVESAQTAALDGLSAATRRRILAKAGTGGLQRALAEGGLDAGALDRTFDGSRGAGGPGDGTAAAAAGAGPAARLAALRASLRAVPKPVTDLSAAPPPLPRTPVERAQRNYFARGYAAGMTRLEDDAQIALWHALGATKTVGDPTAKAPLIIRQKGPTCGVGAQYEAMKARGLPADMAVLAAEGIARGYYSEYELKNGTRDGGTYADEMGALLKAHGVASTAEKGSPKELDAALRRSGDAIVFMAAKRLWNDPSLSEGAGHFVYVTGEEVDPKGAVYGYYINDTGTGEGARFVRTADFERAWSARQHWMVSFDAAK